jgi:hypothetical protein
VKNRLSDLTIRPSKVAASYFLIKLIFIRKKTYEASWEIQMLATLLLMVSLMLLTSLLLLSSWLMLLGSHDVPVVSAVAVDSALFQCYCRQRSLSPTVVVVSVFLLLTLILRVLLLLLLLLLLLKSLLLPEFPQVMALTSFGIP